MLRSWFHQCLVTRQQKPHWGLLAVQSPRSGLNWKKWIAHLHTRLESRVSTKCCWEDDQIPLTEHIICNKPTVICKDVALAASWQKWIHVGMFLGSMVTLGRFLTFVTPSYPILQVGSLWRVCTHMLVPEPLPHGKNRRSSVLAGFLPSKVWRFFFRSLLEIFCLFMMGIHIMITRSPSNSEMTFCLHFQ